MAKKQRVSEEAAIEADQNAVEQPVENSDTGVSAAKAAYGRLIAKYKEQNPVKYALKKDALQRRYDEMA